MKHPATGTDHARPFLPARDFALSARFYEALGFRVLLRGQVVIFAAGTSSFILQEYFHEEYARHCMMQLMVDDLDAWWERLRSLNLPATFGIPEPKAPVMQPWGLRVGYLVDPSGILWHIAERRPGHPADQ